MTLQNCGSYSIWYHDNPADTRTCTRAAFFAAVISCRLIGFLKVESFGVKYSTMLISSKPMTLISYVWSKMSGKNREKLLKLYFGPGSSNYYICRTHIQSCDFSLGSRSYVKEGDLGGTRWISQNPMATL